MGKYEWAVGQEVMVTTIADHGRQEVIRTVEAVSRGVATVTGMRFRRDGVTYSVPPIDRHPKQIRGLRPPGFSAPRSGAARGGSSFSPAQALA